MILTWAEIEHFCNMVMMMSFDQIQQTREYHYLKSLQNNLPIFISCSDIGNPSGLDRERFSWQSRELKKAQNAVEEVIEFQSLNDVFLQLEQYYKLQPQFDDRHECLKDATDIMDSVSTRHTLEQAEDLMQCMTF